MTAARVVVVLVFSVVDLLDGLLAVAAPVPSPKEEENVVEKDGVRFEVVVPQRTWAIPEDKPAGAAPVKLALRITNRTKSPLGVLVRRELVGRVFGVLRWSTEFRAL